MPTCSLKGYRNCQMSKEAFFGNCTCIRNINRPGLPWRPFNFFSQHLNLYFVDTENYEFNEKHRLIFFVYLSICIKKGQKTDETEQKITNL